MTKDDMFIPSEYEKNCITPGTPENEQHQRKFKIWEEFDGFVYKMIKNYGLNDQLRLEMFLLLCKYTDSAADITELSGNPG